MLTLTIPEELEFTQIALYAKVGDFNKAKESIEMVANAGDSNKSWPTLDEK